MDCPRTTGQAARMENAEAIGGERMLETILKTTDSCYACAVRCKRVVEITEGPYRADPRYGGPEYESISALGSYCGISNLPAIAHANQLCNMYGMDTIACGGDHRLGDGLLRTGAAHAGRYRRHRTALWQC